ncbi:MULTISPECIES: GNAT family N-acetyltransferase [Providencia]|uniref:GNAT family N-acetyltransferase n=1 Tax=Providencia TaxID=586 RepID=UPI000F783F05|nr:GNAT family N-acetyltransferase [Providencia rettgeri]MBV2190562.1 GNAT family N-acetyltransferase [Providencia rettgeri]
MLYGLRVSSEDSQTIAMINQLYDTAFPLYEQRSYQGREAILNHSDYYLFSFKENDIFIGFIGCWKIEDYYYIEHLAISPVLRGQGYGQKVLKQFCHDVGKVILEIDPIIDDVSQKRWSFYRHCGFQQNEYAHAHPSYYPGNKPHKLRVLSYPEAIAEEVYQQFNHALQTLVMNKALL